MLRAFILCVYLLATSSVLAWDVRERISDDPLGVGPIATLTNGSGDSVEIYRDNNDFVYVVLKLNEGFTSFGISSCATFQIDKRRPVHHYDVGASCTVKSKTMTIFLGDIVDDRVISLPLHRFINGNNVSFRYITSTGEYRQSVFSLSRSKQALSQAIGLNVTVQPKLETASP